MLLEGHKKRVVVIDSELNIFERFHNSEDVEIVLLVVENEKQKEKVKQIKKDIDVYTFREVNEYKDRYLTRQEIDEYRYIQVKVERFVERFNELNSYAIMTYYCSLAFWIDKIVNIDTVFCQRNEHGASVDSLAIEVAKKKGVPVFGPVSVFKNSKMQAFAIRCYNTGKTVNLYEIDENYNRTGVSMVEALYYKNTEADKVELKRIRKSFNRFWLKNAIRESITRKYLVEYKAGIEYCLRPKEIFSNIFFVKNLKKTYDKLIVKEIEDNRPGVFYALHYEPEASFMNKVQYDSQLYNISMLADSLPTGWVLYVKEHPHQFRLVNRTKFMALKSIQRYRNADFYKKIAELPNVRLLDCDLNSDKIIHNKNIKVSASINGTIALECIKNNKAVMLFDAESVTYGEHADIIKINNKQDIDEALKRIDNNEYMVDYNKSIDEISRYVLINYLKGNPWIMPYSVLETLFKNGEQFISL